MLRETPGSCCTAESHRLMANLRGRERGNTVHGSQPTPPNPVPCRASRPSPSYLARGACVPAPTEGRALTRQPCPLAQAGEPQAAGSGREPQGPVFSSTSPRPPSSFLRGPVSPTAETEAPPDAGAAPGEAQRLQCRALQGGSAAHLKGGTGQVCQGARRPRADEGPSLAGGGATGPAATPSPGARGATPWVPQPAPAHWLGAVPWPRPVQGQGWAWVGHIWPADQPSEAGLTTMALTGAQVPEAQWPVSAGGGRAPQVPPAQPGNPCTSQP